MSAPTVNWNHQNITGNSDGVATLSTANSTGTRPVNFGGFVAGNSSDTSVSSSGADTNVPVIGTHVEYDSGTDTQYGVVCFAVPRGASVRAHVYCIV